MSGDDVSLKILSLAEKILAKISDGQAPDAPEENRRTKRSDIKPDGAAIRHLRIDQKLTIPQLAGQAGIDPRVVSSIESNADYHCQLSTIAALAGVFKVATTALIVETAVRFDRVLTSAAEISQTAVDIAFSATEILVSMGSRSRDEKYLHTIENALIHNRGLVHCRVLMHPPFSAILQQHLLRLLDIRDRPDRLPDRKTVNIGIYRDVVRQPEFAGCANEKRALLIAPFVNNAGDYTLALVIEGPDFAKQMLQIGKGLYERSERLETSEALLGVGLVERHE